MHHSFAGLAIVSVLGGTSFIAVATATPALATAPTPVCGATSCTTTFAETGAVQTFTVPSFASSLLVTASGGGGGDEKSGPPPDGTTVGAGGGGGSSTAEVPVTPEEILSVVVGGAGTSAAIGGISGGAAGYGGGNHGGSGGGGIPGPGISRGAGGGGGSFVFDAGNVLLIAAGGGGGAAAPSTTGGVGGGANGAAAGTGNHGGGGGPGTADHNGSGGFGADGALNAGDGSGEASSPSSLPLGGVGGTGSSLGSPSPGSGGGGGGGGYHAGGGGGGAGGSSSGGGGGGAGYAIASATDVSGVAGAQSGNGVVTISYDKGAQVVMFTSTPPAVSSLGGTYGVTATGGGSGNDVVLSIDGTTTNDSCSLSGSTVSFDHLGSCVIDADQGGDDDYLAASTAQQTVTVVRKPTVTAVSVKPKTIVVSVAPVAPNVGTPTGSAAVTVDGKSVGTAALSGGVVTLNHVVPAGRTHQVAATYAGDSTFSGSSSTVLRRDPTVTATVSSAKAPSHGWYRKPVVIHFHCTATSAPLTKSCPGSVTLSGSGKGQSVKRTVTATDGGATTVVVGKLDIDQVKPTVKITGPKAGQSYPHKVPKAHCVGHDALSGVLECTLRSHLSGHHVTITATVTDRAGNTASRRLTYSV